MRKRAEFLINKEREGPVCALTMKSLTIEKTHFVPTQKISTARLAELAPTIASLLSRGKRLTAQILLTSLVYLFLLGFGILMLTTTGRPI